MKMYKIEKRSLFWVKGAPEFILRVEYRMEGILCCQERRVPIVHIGKYEMMFTDHESFKFFRNEWSAMHLIYEVQV